MNKTINKDSKDSLLESKREYREALFYELKSKGYKSDEANSIIDKSDFNSLLENFTDEVFHVSIPNMADDVIRKVMRMNKN